MVLALPELAWIAGLLFAFGCVWVLRKFIEAMLGTLISDIEAIPGVGSILGGVLRSIEQAVANALGTAEGAIDKALGASIHFLARQFDWLWREFEAHATLIADIASGIYPLVAAYHAVRGLLHDLSRAGTAERGEIHSLTREYHGIEHRVKTLEHDVAKGIGHDVLPRVRTLEHEVGHVTGKVIPAIEAADAQAETAISDLWTWARQNVLVAGTTAFAAAVAVALSSLGLGNLRCPSFGRFLNKWGCGLGSLLDDALGLLIAAVALESVCEFLPLIEDAFGAVIGPMTHLLTEVPLGSCETIPEGWATLNVAAGPLPPTQSLGAYPS